MEEKKIRKRGECRVPAFQGESLSSLKAYIRNPEFKLLLHNLVRAQSATEFKSLSVIGIGNDEARSFFVCSLALAYSCYLQSRVLIVETIEQPTDRSLLLECILGEHSPVGHFPAGAEPGYIDLLSTESFFEGERELADFHLGEYINQVRERYDLVLVDTASLVEESEDAIHPIIIAGHSDQSLLFVSPDKELNKTHGPTLEVLKKNGITPLGIVEGPDMNGIFVGNNGRKKKRKGLFGGGR